MWQKPATTGIQSRMIASGVVTTILAIPRGSTVKRSFSSAHKLNRKSLKGTNQWEQSLKGTGLSDQSLIGTNKWDQYLKGTSQSKPCLKGTSKSEQCLIDTRPIRSLFLKVTWLFLKIMWLLVNNNKNKNKKWKNAKIHKIAELAQWKNQISRKSRGASQK